MTNSKNLISQEYLKQLRNEAEAELSNQLLKSKSSTEGDRLAEELQLHQIELEIQYSALQAAQLEIEVVRNRYQSIIEYLPYGHLTLNEKGLVVETNLTANKILGVNRNELLLSPLSKYMTSQSADLHYLKMLDMTLTNASQQYDVEIKSKAESFRKVHINLIRVISDYDNSQIQVSLFDFTTQNSEINKALIVKNNEKEKCTAELNIANQTVIFQNDEMEKRAAELFIANQELIFQNKEKEKRAAELFIANQELIFQNTEKEKRAAELLMANQDLCIAAATFESQEVMMVTDANNIILRVNKAFSRVTGYSAEEAIGQTPRFLSSGKQNKEFYAEMWESINTLGGWEGNIWNKRKNGDIQPERLSITAVKDVDGIVKNYVATLTGIVMSQDAADEIKNLAFYDSLTLLPNRRMLLDRLSKALAHSARSYKQGALLFLDLDHFKTLNDTLGHFIGDLLLQQVASRLNQCIRESDTVARIGGDEFVVLLEDLSTHADEATAETRRVADKILNALNQPYLLNVHNYYITTSIGVTLFNDHEFDTNELLKQADIAMYQSKKDGRNMIRYFNPEMQDSISAVAELERELRKAAEKHQFQLYYQVQVDSNNQPVGAEALIRWHHHERGMISPAIFIPLAEEIGLISNIGQWVFDTVCAQIKTWQSDILTKDLVIAVNVSAKQFYQVDYVEQVLSTIERYGINPANIKIELTESTLVNNINDIITKMNALNKIGITFSLDDFGTGYSSLQYLKMLPLDQLKIDKSFVRDIATDSSDRAIVRTIITMASSLKINVIAEGVETEEQRKFLFDNGCNNFQGYLFRKPLPAEEFRFSLRT